eukprot:4805074-Amphidinium_carterae.1
MLAVQTALTTQDGAEVKQIHISNAADNAAGAFLATWASWSTIASYTSTSALAAILPGRRSFEVDEPAAAKVKQCDLVIHDPTLDKRFPRAITLVQLGSLPVSVAHVKSDTMVPEPGTPLELILEVDARAANEAEPKNLVKTFVADALLAQGTPNRLYPARLLDDDPNLLLCVKMRVNATEASSMLSKSGDNGVFTRLAAHSQDDANVCVIVWLSDEGMNKPHPLQSLRALRTQHPTIAGLCRSRQHFGVRVPPTIAGAIRIALDVQKARQMSWNSHIVPAHKFVVRGLPATMTDVEATTLIYNGFNWPQFPIKRVKATALGSAVWLVGALEPPKELHLQLGVFLVTVENATPAEQLSKKAKATRANRGRADAKLTRSPWTAPSTSTWQSWTGASSRATDPESWWGPSRSQRPSADSADPWSGYAGRQEVTAKIPDDGKVTALEQRINRIEKASSDHSNQIATVTNRLGKVETEVSSLGSKMQDNFDRLFAAFESRASDEPGQHRKAPRLAEERGGSVSVVDFGELDLDPSLVHVAYCNPSTHKGHLDHLLQANFDILGLGEANHTQAEMQSSRFIPTEGKTGIKYHLHWTPPTRVAGDHHTPGRASSGLVFAAKHLPVKHPFASDQLLALESSGRCLMRRIAIRPRMWLNVFMVYAPITGWKDDHDESFEFLTALYREVLSFPDEHTLILGDFNLEHPDDAVSQSVQAMGGVVDVGAAFSADGRQPPTYATRSTQRAIDRALCTQSLLPMVKSLQICQHAGTGPHSPI